MNCNIPKGGWDAPFDEWSDDMKELWKPTCSKASNNYERLSGKPRELMPYDVINAVFQAWKANIS